jgi:hypothetical protein
VVQRAQRGAKRVKYDHGQQTDVEKQVVKRQKDLVLQRARRSAKKIKCDHEQQTDVEKYIPHADPANAGQNRKTHRVDMSLKVEEFTPSAGLVTNEAVGNERMEEWYQIV